jgi:putative DNA primase/helicase
MANVDLADLKARVSLVDLIGEDVALVKVGCEHKGLCPLHSDKSPSLRVYVDSAGAERWYCHACQCGGDHYEWLKKRYGMGWPASIEAMQHRAGGPLEPLREQVGSTASPSAPERKWTVGMPPPNAPPPMTLRRGPKRGAEPVTEAYAYRQADGALAFYVCRIDPPSGKQTIPCCWSKEDNKWRQGAFPSPRLLYGLHLLEGADRVLLVEGEKTCNAARTLVPDIVCMSWPGGCGGVNHVDLTPLSGKDVTLFPDCDSQRYPDGHDLAGMFKPYNEQPGQKAMLRIAAKLLDLGCTVHLVKVPEPGEWPNGFDLADALAEGWTTQGALAFIDEHSTMLTANDEQTDDEPPSLLDDLPPGDGRQNHARLVEVTDDYMPLSPEELNPQKTSNSRKPKKQPLSEGAVKTGVKFAHELGDIAPDREDVEPPRLTIEQAMPKDADDVSEDRIALLFEAIFHHKLRYCKGHSAWRVYDGNIWHRDETLQVMDYIRECCRHGSSKKPSLLKQRTIVAIEKLARASRVFAVKSNIWNTNIWRAGAQSVTVDLETGETSPPNPQDYITKQFSVDPAPRGTPCPVFDRLMADITLGDKAYARFLLQIFGYCLTGDTTEQKMFFIYGHGGNGKSVLINVIVWILGDYAKVALSDTFTASKNDRHPTDVAMLEGARLVTASETEEGRSWAEAKIKQLTGAEPVSARYMRCDPFTFTPQFKLIVIGNHKPSLANVDAATRRRFVILPFMHKPATPDKHLERKLRVEGPAILRRMIDGCLDWKKNGFLIPQVVIDATEQYFEDQDLLGQWLEDDCVEGPDSGKHSDLFSSWSVYARAAGEETKSGKAFTQEMVKRGYERGIVEGSRGFKRISLKLPPEGTGSRYGKDD